MLVVQLGDIVAPSFSLFELAISVRLKNPDENVKLRSSELYYPAEFNWSDAIAIEDAVANSDRDPYVCIEIVTNDITKATCLVELDMPLIEERRMLTLTGYFVGAIHNIKQSIRLGRLAIALQHHEEVLRSAPSTPEKGTLRRKKSGATGTGKSKSDDGKDKGKSNSNSESRGSTQKQSADGARGGEKDGDDARVGTGDRLPKGIEREKTKAALNKEGNREGTTSARETSNSLGEQGGTQVDGVPRKHDVSGAKSDSDNGNDDEQELVSDDRYLDANDDLALNNLLTKEHKSVHFSIETQEESGDAAKLILAFDRVAQRLREATKDLETHRQHHKELQGQLIRYSRMLAENKAAFETEMDLEHLPTLTHDQLVTSYLSLAENFTTTIGARESHKETLSTLQNELIQRRNDEKKLILLQEKHTADCHRTQKLQSQLAKAEKYKAVWSQQHLVIEKLETMLLRLDPYFFKHETLLRGVHYQKAIVENLQLVKRVHEKRTQMLRTLNGEKRNPLAISTTSLASTSAEVGSSTNESSNFDARDGLSTAVTQGEGDDPHHEAQQFAIENRALIQTLEERKQSLESEISKAKQAHRDEVARLRAAIMEKRTASTA